MRHTCTIDSGSTISVLKLIIYCEENLQTERISIDKIQQVYRSKRSGFEKLRYANADLRFPPIITEDNILVDGRHRVLKAKDLGRKFLTVYKVKEKVLKRKSSQIK